MLAAGELYQRAGAEGAGAAPAELAAAGAAGKAERVREWEAGFRGFREKWEAGADFEDRLARDDTAANDDPPDPFFPV